MSRTKIAWVLTAVLVAFGGRASAQGMEATDWTPSKVAAAIEAQVASTSFDKLEAFGRASLELPAPERLRRLDHVAWIYVNQSDFGRFDTWNNLLAREAARAHDRRFERVAEINALRSRYDQGDTSAVAKVSAIANADPDWYVRVFAISVESYFMERNAEVGATLRRLADADSLIPDHDPLTNLARSRVWESEGLVLMQLHDLQASAAAFGHTQIEYETPGYPRPDFDGIYNMAALAAELGQQDVAEDLVRRHHRLVERSNLAGLDVWDQNLCAHVAEHVSAQKVLDCLKGLDLISPASKAHFLARKMLPLRAIAYAKLGQAANAERDLKAMQALYRESGSSTALFERLPEVEAAVLHAEGRDAAAYARLDDYLHAHETRANVQFSAGISQLTGEMQKQLGVRRDQLVTARRNADLERDVIGTQRLLDVVGGVVTLSVFALLLWQWRVAGQLRRARKAAESANRAKSEFLANMSHEIRTPLNGVVAVADMLVRSDLPPKAREMAEIICSSGDTLQRLLSDILDVARIESGKIAIEAAPFDVRHMVRAVAALSQLKCDERGVGLVVEVAAEVEQTVTGDLVRVRQVVTNLLSNAAKFTERGEVRLQVARTADGLMRFTVSDTGVGFAMADKSKVLGRFEQADSSITRRFGGTGLGLSICCDLAQLMGGVLDCESEAGAGSRFWLELPLPAVQAAPEVSAALPSMLEPAVADAEGAPLRILLADDHPTNRKVVELMLEGGVAELTSVENGAQALEMFHAKRFDLILMDMQMPVMDGLTAIGEIRRAELAQRLVRTPIVMLTANALPEHVSSAIAAGADLHLSKPFTAAALFDTIASAFPDPQALGAEAA